MDPKNEEKLLGMLTQVLAENNKLMALVAKQQASHVADDDYQAQHDAVQAKLHPPGPDQIVYRAITTSSGAVWDFIISPQDKKVFDLAFVRLPEGADRQQKDGGIIPDGLQVYERPQAHRPQLDAEGNDHSVVPFDQSEFTMAYRQYIRENFTLQDRRQYVGKPMPEHLKPKGKVTTDKAAE
jgi:hypothetical protein